MKLKFNQLFGAFALSLLLFACNDSDPEQPLGAYEQGILIMNEGILGQMTEKFIIWTQAQKP
ncbi:hypothetical protein V8V91_21445 [Algoriphagus halophilus]|uniref:hypothetical protein n=1 Tax=Algoriphagus halophilus TaxID=226505 RepID=UPI00358E906D